MAASRRWRSYLSRFDQQRGMVIKRLVIERQRAVDLGQPALESRAPRRETLHALRVAFATRKATTQRARFRHAGAAAKVSAYDPRYDPPA
jgi:hypothetical protein